MKLYDEISRVAYELYEKSGRIPGRDELNWLEAEKIVRARHALKEAAAREAEKKETVKQGSDEPAVKAVTRTRTRKSETTSAEAKKAKTTATRPKKTKE